MAENGTTTVPGYTNRNRQVVLEPRLEEAFDEAMLRLYVRAKNEAGYTASYFHRMLLERGGVETARHLLLATSDGYRALWERQRLDLTVEVLVLEARWKDLFSDAERQMAVTRLEGSRYTGPLA